MRCVIMQPTYLPWAGYFNLMAHADHFVFLDDVQFEKQSWQCRNRVLVNGSPHWLSVPVKQSLADTVREVRVDRSKNWQRKQLALLQQSYAKHPYSGELIALLEPIFSRDLEYLCELNTHIIAAFAKKLGIGSATYFSSDLNVDGARSERLLKICNALQCAEYLSPVGSADYLNEDGVFEGASVALTFQSYSVSPYEQRGSSEFVSHLSIYDVVANLGWSGAREYVLNGNLAADSAASLS